MRIRDDKFHPAQPSSGQLAEELSPDCFGLGRADLHAQHFTPAVGIDADGNDDRDRDDAPAAPDLQVGGVDPEIGPFPFDGPVEEGFDLVVDLFAEPGHLALGRCHDMPMALTRSSTERVETPWI
jgi:hypothetical protein